MTTPIIPSLFKLVGDGFVDDVYAANGNHLRWMFDPRLGFPRFAFCLDRRPAVGTNRSVQVPTFTESFAIPTTTTVEIPRETDRIIRPGLAVYRRDALMTLGENGITLNDRPVIIDFHAGSAGLPNPYACWVRLQFKVTIPGGAIAAAALYENRGEDEVVDRQRRDYPRSGLLDPGFGGFELDAIRGEMAALDPLMRLLDKPQRGTSPPVLRDQETRQLYRILLADRLNFYANVTPRYLASVVAALKEQGLSVSDLAPSPALPGFTVSKVIFIELRAERIDRVAVTGSRAQLTSVQWARTEDLMNAGDWQPVACYPIATDDLDYFQRNQDHYGGLPPDGVAVKRVLDPLPRGAEPLDDPQAPPSRPPTDDEMRRHYLLPWRTRLEPWVERILTESAPGVFHQSETRITAPVTEFGQKSGDGVPPPIASQPDQTMEIRPYGLLLAASCAFRIARLLGLAAIDLPPENIPWDYRVRGRWLESDILAWGNKVTRDLSALLAKLSSVTPFELPNLEADIATAFYEASATASFLSFISSIAEEGVVTLRALKLGVQATRHDLFAGPARLDVEYDDLALPDRNHQQAVASVEWPLRQRERVIIDEEIPLGAAIGRRLSSATGPFDIINPAHPDVTPVTHEAIIPAGPSDAPGTSGTAVFHDRHVDDGVSYRYGVSEADPFSRWSRFTEADFRWDFDIPPPPPVQISASLDLAGSPPAFQLTVKFSWATDLFPADDHRFLLRLRRSPLPSANPNDPAHWQKCERVEGDGTGPFEFAGNFTGDATHDGMPVNVLFSSRTVTDPALNVQSYRDYTVTFTGLVLNRDAIDRALVFVGVSARDARGHDSEEVGGPARAEHFLATPPPAPALPAGVEKATFADALRVSSYTLQWNGAANVRYIAYRAGELELIKLLQDRGVDTSSYNPEAAPDLRAAALRQLAPQARDAFEPRSDLLPDPPRDPAHPDKHLDPVLWPALPASARSFTDPLPGKLRTLSVYTALGRSRAGILSDWPASPSAFVVVEVPHAPEPARPVVLRASWKPPENPPPVPPEAGAARVELLITKPPAESAVVTAYEVYRTLAPAKTDDYRLMRPLHVLDSPVYNPSGSAAIPGVDNTLVATYIDPTIRPWKTYYYRVVARSAGTNGSLRGMRSEASALIEVDTFDNGNPVAPSAIAVARSASDVTISFQAEAPDTPAGDFIFEVLLFTDANPLIVARVAAVEARQPPDLFRLTIAASVLPSGSRIAVRVTSPLGRRSQSTPVII